MLGWSYSVKHNGESKHYEISRDLGLSRKISEVAEEELDCSEIYADGPCPEAYFKGCGYPNKYLIRNKNLPDPVADLPGDALLTVELWDQS